MQNVSVMDDDLGAAIDEKDMIRAAQADPTAFDMLYHRYADQVYAYLRTRTSTVDDAADLTQQVFLQALRALPRYHMTQAPFAAWLFMSATPICLRPMMGPPAPWFATSMRPCRRR